MPLVYKATNTINGKSYIGVTRRTLIVRMKDHKYNALSGIDNVFYRAIRKYGWDSFVWEVLEDNVPIDQLDTRERDLISQHNTFSDSGRGYNRTLGGGGTSGLIFTDEQRDSVRRAVRESHIKRFGLKRQARLFHNRTGVPHAAEVKQRISETLRALPLGTVPAKLHHSEWPKIQELRESGLSFREIGSRYGVRPETVFYFCKRREVRPE